MAAAAAPVSTAAAAPAVTVTLEEEREGEREKVGEEETRRDGRTRKPTHVTVTTRREAEGVSQRNIGREGERHDLTSGG